MQNAVNFVSDGLGLTPPEFAEVLLRCTQADQIQLDSYALGGMVEQVEQKFRRAKRCYYCPLTVG